MGKESGRGKVILLASMDQVGTKETPTGTENVSAVCVTSGRVEANTFGKDGILKGNNAVLAASIFTLVEMHH